MQLAVLTAHRSQKESISYAVFLTDLLALIHESLILSYNIKPHTALKQIFTFLSSLSKLETIN
jgi:hypothetical protein